MITNAANVAQETARHKGLLVEHTTTYDLVLPQRKPDLIMSLQYISNYPFLSNLGNRVTCETTPGGYDRQNPNCEGEMTWSYKQTLRGKKRDRDGVVGGMSLHAHT